MKKIMFKDKYGLTDAVLRGRKTMTRRIIPLTDTDREHLNTAFDRDLRERVIIDRYAKYKVGEVVAVAQRYKEVVYEPHTVGECLADEKYSINLKYENGWNNKMYVKAAYMPHRIRIIDIKVEKLQDISDEECLKEGLIKMFFGYCYEYHDRHGRSFKGSVSIRDAFADLIDGISGKGTWESNPWVFAYSFKLVK